MKHEQAPTAADPKGFLIFRIRLCFENSQLLDILTKFGPFLAAYLATTVKWHIYKWRPFSAAYNQVSITCQKYNPFKHKLKNKQFFFWQFWPISPPKIGQIWPILSGSSTRHDHSFEHLNLPFRSSSPWTNQFRNTVVLGHLGHIRNFRWPNLAEPVKRYHDLSF